MTEAPLILVVDDEQSYRDALRIALEREGSGSRSPSTVPTRWSASTPHARGWCCST